MKSFSLYFALNLLTLALILIILLAFGVDIYENLFSIICWYLFIFNFMIYETEQ